MNKLAIAGAAIAAGITLLCASGAHAQSAKPFFEARGKDRCASLNSWSEGIQARAPGIDLYNQNYDMVVDLAIPSFENDLFVPAFGKPFRELSDRDKKAVQDALRSCYGTANWYGVLATGFEVIPGRMGLEWTRAIAKIGTSAPAAAPNYRIGTQPPPASPVAGPPYLASRAAPSALQGMRLMPCPETRTTDVYFAPEVYALVAGVDDYDPRELVDGNLIDCALKGAKLTVADVQSVAAETFIRRANGAGLAGTDVVQAMHDGRLNPAWQDVELAWHGLVRMSPYVLPPATIAAMQRDGRWNNGSPNRAEFASIVEQMRPKAWQQRFGSYESFPSGDYLRELFTALATGSATSAAAAARYAAVRSDGAYGQRMAVIVRESAERRTAEAAEAQRRANRPEGERLSAAIDALLSPLDRGFDQVDDFEESMLDAGGVVYRDSGGAKGAASVTLCNHLGAQIRMAALVAWVKRRDRLDPDRKADYQVRGWSHLAQGQCAAVRVGADNAAFLVIERWNGDAFRPVHLDVPGNPEDELVRDRVVAANLQACGDVDEGFFYSSQELTKINHCSEGFDLLQFGYLLQHSDSAAFTVTLGDEE